MVNQKIFSDKNINDAMIADGNMGHTGKAYPVCIICIDQIN